MIFLRIAGALLVVLLLLAVAGSAVAYATVTTWLQGLPNYQSPAAFQVAQPTVVYSADGKLLARFYLQNRDVVPISQMSTDLVNGLVAVEDERYFEHGAVDPVGIVRAAFQTSGGNRQWASTITQQYVRNTVLLGERTQMTLERKVREAYLAIQVERTLSKQQILENYLNTVYFGEGAYGADAAARTYFAKSASQLTLPEGALIAGLVQSPSRLDPYINPTGAVARRQAVLSRMLYNHYITQAAYNAAVSAPLALKRETQPLEGIYAAPYFVSYVRTLLQQQFSANTVFNGGLTVYTSLDTRLQADAEKAAHHQFNGSKDPSVALVSIDPNNGYVKALVGGTNYAKSKFNLATQGYRQPGSSFKMFTLVTALADGMSPTFQVDSNAPVTIPAKPNPWVVNNDEGTGSGMMSLETATWNSVNAVYARVAYYGVGIKSVIHTAKSMGITTHLPSIPSITLGSVGCTPLEMASAYGTLATGGAHYAPIVITKVLDRSGSTIFQAQPHGSQVVQPDIAYAATKVLEGVITKGTARNTANIGRPAAGKTGTSQSNRDCWFVGYTPQLVTSVWVGFTPERTVVVNGQTGFGATVAAPIWARYMTAALAGKPIRDFTSAPDPSYDDSRFNIPVSYATQNPPPPPSTKSVTTPKASKSSSGGNKSGGSGKGTGNGHTKPTPPPPPSNPTTP
ncbi:MAG: PBP1A family penicillin-binding protein [Coriobacteriia bacterium]|nr:PBP1A family penicillin-binding protein [Coriobacteriia bacterium]